MMLQGLPSLSSAGDIGARLFKGEQCFLKRSLSLRIKSQIVLRETAMPGDTSPVFRPCSVRCGF